jgi:hypothetical protein
VGFPDASLEAGLHHESISLKAGKVCPYGVIGEMQLIGQLVNRGLSGAQKLKNFPSRAFEQPRAPAYVFHD